MIQRKQTVFLLIAIIIVSTQFFIPFQTFTYNNEEWPICLLPGCSFEISNSNLNVVFVLNILTLILTGFIIFLYKKRVLQYKLTNFTVLLNMLMLGLFFSLSFIKNNLTGSVNYQIGSFLPILSAFFCYLAAVGIKKDIELVRSADRIR
jgi:hypothetical protein